MQALFTCSASRFAGQAPVAARHGLPRLCLALLCISLVAEMNQTYQSAHSWWSSPRLLLSVAVALTLFIPSVRAQNAPNAPAASASAPSSPSATERARRDADKVFQMILMHSDKARAPASTPVKQAVTRDVSPGASAGPAAAARPPVSAAPAPVQAALRTTPAAAPAATVAARTPAVPAAAPALPAVSPDATSAAPLVSPPPAVEPTPAPTAPAPNATSALPTRAAAQPVAPPEVNKLELLSSVEPDFPARLLRTLGSGKVVVQFDVAADGTVSQVDVVQSSHRGLDAAAIAAVKQWRFKPMSGSASGTTELRFE